MTNKQAAEYFASLPPESEAKVCFVDGDGYYAQEDELNMASELSFDFENVDIDEDHLKMPIVFRKY